MLGSASDALVRAVGCCGCVFYVISKRGFKLSCRTETGLVDDVADAAVEACHHAIGLRMAWRDEAMFDLELLAQAVEDVLPAGLLLLALAAEAVGELAAIVREQFAYLDRTGGLYFG